MSEVLAFSMISLLLVISPGPNGVLILKTVSGRGVKAGVENIVGLVSATFLHGIISIFGLSAIILQSAELFMLVKYVGAAYLLYLGIKTIYGTFKGKNLTEKKLTYKNDIKNTACRNFAEGFLTQILNPKVSMFYLAAFPQFVNFEAHSLIGAFALVCIHASIIFFWFLGLSLFVSKIKLVARDSRLGLWIQRLSGGILVYFSGLIVTQEVNR